MTTPQEGILSVKYEVYNRVKTVYKVKEDSIISRIGFALSK